MVRPSLLALGLMCWAAAALADAPADSARHDAPPLARPRVAAPT